MKPTQYIPMLLILLAALTGCKGGEQSGNEGGDDASDFADLERSSYNTGGVSFSLADFPDLYKVNRDSVQWGHLLPQTEENGPIVYYFTTTEQTLAAPHIRLEYIDKNIPNMGTVESIHGWLKSTFLNEYQQGKVLSEGNFLSTMDGQKVQLLEIHRPGGQVNDSIVRGDKFMAWSYVDHQDRFVALNFSATEQDDYDQGLPQFQDLIRSYKDE